MISPAGTEVFVTRDFACSAQSPTNLPSNRSVGLFASRSNSARNIVISRCRRPCAAALSHMYWQIVCQRPSRYLTDRTQHSRGAHKTGCPNVGIARMRADDLSPSDKESLCFPQSHGSQVTLELCRERTGATVSVGLTLGVRFRYSRLKEATLFAAGAMGFQSILVWKLLKRTVSAGRSSNRNSLNKS